MRALIIAAGRGSRLVSRSDERPKSLIAINRKTILEHILGQVLAAGVSEVVIVTGYRAEAISSHLGDGSELGMSIGYVMNEHWEKKNGVSVLAARSAFEEGERFLLMMSDHLFSSSLPRELLAYPSAGMETILAIDRRTDAILDPDDATKVATRGSLITDIDKSLVKYDAIDCGLFRCSYNLFDALDSSLVDEDCSLTDGCKILAKKNLLHGMDIGDGSWLDVDTPEALTYAEAHLPRILGEG